MMPQEICLDANVFVAAMLPSEGGHPAALDVLKKVHEFQIPLYEPAVLLFEVASVIHRKKMAGEMRGDEAEEVLDLFYQLPLLLQWQPGILKKGSQLAAQFGLKRIFDCTYLSVAQLRDIPLVTFDEELIKKGKKVFRHLQSVPEFLESIIS